ncbi:DUF2382 domain-containing protein [Segetibacter sp. 3557_3]|uniref:YsnF/AvaK domain-containing protein n=1 Tax=Segetibacter sp. 3557_3 TaxID=2547429 RepID=UPI00105912DC|nr:YsnF/AvaK domain-containing protein [Segetibacter sp. 3557_3]TDH21436.1 DUF2382 domain-containing protein [Segetibacter sp. 3557_3]
MAQTVIGLFDSSAEAQQAVQNLTSRGISRENIDVSSSGSTGTTSTTNTDDDDHQESGISRFFKNLFGNDDDSDRYAHVAKRSGCIVTVHAQTSEQAEEAADILDDAGAVNVDERAASYGYSGRNSGSTSDMSGSTGSGLSGAGLAGAGLAGSTGLTGSSSGSTSTGSLDTTGAYDTTNDYSTEGTTRGSADNLGSTGLTGSDNTYSGTSDFTTSGSSDLNDSRSDRSDFSDTNESRKIPIIEENLQVGKREVLTGGVRLRSRIVERPVEESLRLREENVRVERTAVDRAATSADLNNFEGTEIEMTERAEVPVVSKEARVVEEISLDKDVEERTETISDTVRRTEVDVEDIERDDLSGNRTKGSDL